MKRLLALCLTLTLCLGLVPAAYAATVDGEYTDVAKTDACYEAVQWARAQEIVLGTSPTTFSPADTCTRGQVMTLLWRAAGSPAPTGAYNPFRDVQETDYYYEAILWAVEQGIAKGTTATTFSPQELCTYAQVLTLLWRAEGCPVASGASVLAYLCGDTYYTKAVAWADYVDVLTQQPETFQPGAPCPRGDIVVYLFAVYGSGAEQPTAQRPDFFTVTPMFTTGRGDILEGSFRVTLPISWWDAVEYRTDETDFTNGITFYERNSRAAGMGGRLFTLMEVSEYWKHDFYPDYAVVGSLITASEYYEVIVVIYPTDVQFTAETAADYQALFDQIPGILKGITGNEGCSYTAIN